MIHKFFFIAGAFFLIAALWHHHRMACYRNHHSHFRHFLKWRLKGIGRRLKLNADQKIKLHQLAEFFGNIHNEIAEAHRQAGRLFLKEIQKENIDKAVVTGLIETHLGKVRSRIPEAVGKLSDFLSWRPDSQEIQNHVYQAREKVLSETIPDGV